MRRCFPRSARRTPCRWISTEAKLGAYLRDFCYRDPAAGWHTDKAIRDTGPYTARLVGGEWVGTYYGTHAPVIVWYSPDMFAWMRANRAEDPAARPAHPAPVPDGAIMIKEMYPAPAAACRGIDPLRLLPTSGAAIMVRDATASHDGWFWGWFGWNEWSPDWPAKPAQGLADMGFGQYLLELPRLGAGQFHLREPAKRERRAGVFSEFSEPGLLPRPIPADPIRADSQS